MTTDNELAGLVKPLQWESFDAWTHWARMDRGSYYIEERNGAWRLGWRVNDQCFPLMHTDDTLPTDLDAAKAAAQADYAARILAALDLSELLHLRAANASLIAANQAMMGRIDAIRAESLEQARREVEAEAREAALQYLSDAGQAADRYAALHDAAQIMREALEYIMDGYGLNAPDFRQQETDENGESIQDDWIVAKCRAALNAKGVSDE